jgi:hypothetical protein
MGRWLLAGLGALFLLVAAANGILAPIVDTCTGGSADSLEMWQISLWTNLFGFGCLCFASRPLVVMAAAAIPTFSAISYTRFAYRFWDGWMYRGWAECTAITGDTSWQMSGNEAHLVTMWLVTAVAFWLGLALTLWLAYRRSRSTQQTEFAHD